MAIVPPGDKQIGSYALTGVVDEGDTLGVLNTATYAIVKNEAVTPTLSPITSVEVGSYALSAVVDEGNSVGILNSALYAVVLYTPPPTASVINAASYAVVKNDTVVATPVAARSVEVGSYALTSVVEEGDSVGMINAGLYAVVKRYDPRYELLIHSLYYGSNDPYLNL